MDKTGQGRGHKGRGRHSRLAESKVLRASVLGAAAALACALAPTGATAAAPTVLSSGVSEVTSTSATLEATINPGGAKTFYHFEYGLNSCTPGPCTKAPIPDGAIETGTSPVAVGAEAKGLAPGTTYHFRVVAKNGTTTNGPDRIFATRPEAVPFGPCSNDALRAPFSAALPDCRTYEQASPVNKNGGDATASIPFTKASPDGSAVSFLSTSGIPGGEGSQTIPMYVARRGTDDWSTQGVLPPATSGQNVHILGWLPDLSEVFHQALRFGSPGKDALLGRSNGGALTEVAPYTPETNYDYAGTSSDGSVVAFETTSKLAGVSTALEGKPNVYAWSGGKLALADVMNNGEVPAEGAFTGPYNWAKGTNKTTLGEGGAAQEYYTQDSHAVSSTGAIFFTAAGTGHLYERLNPTQGQSPLNGEGKCANPTLACTLHVSATLKNNGKGPGGADSAGTRPAAFQAASEDGSVAYFTSSEKLTNDANTGPEPELPAIARSNLDGSGTPDLSFLPAEAHGVAIDSEHVYWADPANGTIGRAKLNGEEKNEAFITPGPVEGVPSEPQWVAVNGTHIYWTNSGEPNEFGEGTDEKGTIGRAKLNGEEVEPAIVKGASNPLGIAVDAEHIYWANSGNEGDGHQGKFRGIGRAKLDGSEAIQPWSEERLTGDPFGWPTNGGVTVDGSFVYFTRPVGNNFSGTNSIERIEKADPTNFEQVVETNTPGARLQGLALQGTQIYWANTGNSTIGRAKLTSGPASEVEEEFIKEAGRPLGLAANASELYWSANQLSEPNPGNDLYRYVGGTLEDITAEPAGDGAEVLGVLGAAKDGSRLYFAANGVLAANAGAMGAHASPGDCQGSIGEMSGSCNLYAWQEGPSGGTRKFIARLDTDGSFDKSDSLDWAPTPTGLFGQGSEKARTAEASGDGATLLFRSQEQLTPYENQGTAELYRYAGDPSGVQCVSCNPSGEAPAGTPGLGSISPSEASPIRPAAVASQNLSADGRRVFFETADALVGADVNGQGGCPVTGSAAQGYPSCLDVYEWEAKDSGSCESESEDGGCLYLISTGKEKEPSLFADASESGEDVFFFTRSQLTGQDQDDLVDVYDAKAKGGLASQDPVHVAPCESTDACHGPASTPPASETPASAGFIGPQNPKPKRPKHKHHHKKHHHHNKHKANAKRGAGR